VRRMLVLWVGTAMAALVVASGVAWAASISCPNRAGSLCVGTNKKDTMNGRNRTDDMRAKGGADILKARGGKDTLAGGWGATRSAAVAPTTPTSSASTTGATTP
jgi:hypothetical protein